MSEANLVWMSFKDGFCRDPSVAKGVVASVHFVHLSILLQAVFFKSEICSCFTWVLFQDNSVNISM